jgi:hypothetical protein
MHAGDTNSHVKLIDHLGDAGIDGRMVLKQILRK